MTWGSISLFGGFLEKGNPLETLIVIFDNVLPKGFPDRKWSISKFVFWRQILYIRDLSHQANRKPQTAVSRLQFHVAKISNFSKAFSSVHFYLAKI